jgi:hypothetical protein
MSATGKFPLTLIVCIVVKHARRLSQRLLGLITATYFFARLEETVKAQALGISYGRT